jgi:hypothetical protein
MLVLIALGAGIAGWWLVGDKAQGYAVTGASFGAQSVCSCRYIAGREAGSCKGDFEPGMEAVFITEDTEAKAVTAWVPLLASETARYREGYGCVLDAWEG